MASGALPPAFPAIRINGDLYWDGGILSNTPTEAIFDDNPRRNSLIFGRPCKLSASAKQSASTPEPHARWNSSPIRDPTAAQCVRVQRFSEASCIGDEPLQCRAVTGPDVQACINVSHAAVKSDLQALGNPINGSEH
jgi:predicted acylesterase/phospholipase RssA